MLLFGDRVWHTPRLAGPPPTAAKPPTERNLRTNTYRRCPPEAVQFRRRRHGRQQGNRGEQMGRVGGRAVWAVFAAALAAGVIGGVAHADEMPTSTATTEAPSRSEYVTQLEAICKPGAKATQKAMDGVRDDVHKPSRIPSPPRNSRRRRRSSAARSTRSRTSRDRSADAVAAEEMVRLPQTPGAVPERNRLRSSRSGHTIKAQRLTARFIHHGNLANNVTLAFGFNYCSFRFSRFG